MTCPICSSSEQWYCHTCKEPLSAVIWVADYQGYDGDKKARNVWRENPSKGYAQQRAFCPYCENDDISEIRADPKGYKEFILDTPTGYEVLK